MYSSVAQSCPTLCDLMDCSTPCPVHQSQSLLKLMSIESMMPSNHLILCHPLPFSIFPSIRVFSKFASGGQSIGVSALGSVLPMNIQDWFPLGWTGWIYLSPKNSQESSPTPQFKSINFSGLSFLHSPTLTSILDHWKTLVKNLSLSQLYNSV